MRLLCFSGATAGGLVCDLLNGTKSNITQSGVKCHAHDVFKDVTPYLDNGIFNETLMSERINYAQSLVKTNDTLCFGTHTHPSRIPQQFIDSFSEILIISTISEKCKYFKYLRYLHLYPHIPVYAPAILQDYAPISNCTEIKFSDIVDGSFVKHYNLDNAHFENWKKTNSYLYDQPISAEIEKFNSILKRKEN